MSAGQQYRARFGFESTGEGVISFNSGEQFTLVSKTDANWWKVRAVNGETGLAPISYLEPCPVRNGGPSKSAAYTTIYDYVPQDSKQLAFTKGQKLLLVDKTDVSWWTMQTPDGCQGLVPVNYIDKLEGPSNTPVPSSSSSPSNHQPHHINGSSEEDIQQVLASIDSSIGRIHDEAGVQGGMYTATQRATLQKLVMHRQNFLAANVPQAPMINHMHSNSSPDHTPLTLTSPTKKELSVRQNPLPKRLAPPPPSSSSSSSSPTKSSLRRSNVDAVSKRKGRSQKTTASAQRYSLHVGGGGGGEEGMEGALQPHYGSLPRRSAPPPPPPTTTAPHPQSSTTTTQDKYYYSLHRPQAHADKKAEITTLPPPSSSSSPRRHSNSSTSGHPPTSPDKTRRASGGSAQESPQHHHPHRQRSSSSISSSSSSRRSSRSQPKSSASPQQMPSSPQQGHSRSASKDNEETKEPPLSNPYIPKALTLPRGPELPTSFTVKEANEVVELVRSRAGITHYKAQQAVGGVLLFLKEHAPPSAGMVDALINALEQAQSDNCVTTVSSGHTDLERLQEIFFEITDCKDDSQQRGWAIHDDEGAIANLLEELLQILCDANPEVSKVAVMEDKYENILTLITYYQMEPRVSIRLLLLKVFGVLCGLDRTVVGILLASVLPNELGRDIQQNTVTELQKTLYSCTVCTMVFSTAEAVPLSVYDLWDVNYMLFLMDTIENPPDEDVEDQMADSFLNMLLAFNQHFPDPATNLVMKALKQKSNPRNLSEKLMYLVNRGEDPVAISEPCCPDSMTKFLLDVFSDRTTSGLFYTTDMRVLIDILTRQLTDLCPGMEMRTHYLELLYRIVGSTDYTDHRHRQNDLMSCLNRISNEEGRVGQADKELVKKIWLAYPIVFDEITDL